MPNSRNLFTTFGAAFAALGIAAVVHAECGDHWYLSAYVDAAAPPGGDGCSWESAFNDLQDALDIEYQSPGTYYTRYIWVAGGVYTPGDGDPWVSFVADDVPLDSAERIRIMGGYAGFANPDDPGQHDPDLYPTVLSGDHLGNDGDDPSTRTDNAYTVLRIPGTGLRTVIFEDLTITGGGTHVNDSHRSLGAVRMQLGANAEFYRCRFIDNRAGWGGAIGFSSAEPWSSPRPYALVQRCYFEGNKAEYGGAIASNGFEEVALINSTFVGNSAAYGGAVEVRDNVTVFGCLFVGNHADVEGGVFVTRAYSPPVISSTFVENSTSGIGPVSVTFTSMHPAVYANCILWDNRDATGSAACDAVYLHFGILNYEYSCAQQLLPHANSISTDPQFVDPIGPDGVPGTGDEDYSLRGDSPCIDMGSASLFYASGHMFELFIDFPVFYPLDLLGEPRIIGPDTDAGAIEFQPGDLTCGTGDVTTSLWPYSGIPDGAVTAADLQFYVYTWQHHRWMAADINTAGVPVDDPAYGTPDGRRTSADLHYFVNHWINGCD